MEQNLLQATAEHDAHVAEQQAEALSEEAKHQSRILEIATRLMKGEKVSPEEENELAVSNPKLYAMAKQMQMLARKSDKNHNDNEVRNDRSGNRDDTPTRNDGDDEEWISPLRQIHEISVSFDVTKNL